MTTRTDAMNAGRWIGALILKTVQFHLTFREMYPN